MTTVVDNIIDSIQSPQTTNSPIPAEVLHADVVLGYIAGNSWLTYEPYRAARPRLARQGRVIPVSLTCLVPPGTKRAMYDMEKGGGRPENIGIFGGRVDRSEPFYLYTFASAGAAMLGWAKHFGYERGVDFYYVSAHANGVKHVCHPDVCGFPASDWTQYLFAGAYDKSCGYDYAVPALPTPVENPYALFPRDVGDHSMPNNGNERLVAEEVDGALSAFRRKKLYRNYLKGHLRPEAKAYRDRLKRIALYEPPDFTRPRAKAAWTPDHRGARWQALNNRIKEIDKIP